MRSEQKIESPAYADLGIVIRWFVRLRWVAIAGVLGTIVASKYLFGYQLPYSTLYIVLALLFATNLVFSRISRGSNLGFAARKAFAAQFHFHVCADYLFLALLTYLTGFLQNPFIYFFCFHIVLTSFIFPKRTVYFYVIVLGVLLFLISLGEYTTVIPHFHLGELSGFNADECIMRIPVRFIGLIIMVGITGYLIVNIKERLEARGQLVELELDKYRGLDRAKSQFILQVTHELRGPVAAVRGYHEMIIKGITGEVPQKTRDALTKANRRTRNLLTIIDEMLDFAYMKSEEEVKHASVPVNLKDVIDYNVELFKPMARQKSVTLRGNVPKELTIVSSRDLMNIILGNLITNAIKYTSSGGTVSVSAEPEGRQIHLQVVDNGMGIQGDEIGKIFEEFYRTRRAREIENDGTGLGLSIVQKAANLLQGRISVYSELNKGTRFHIYLPLMQAEEV
ncbi:MAG: hypothetical protein CMN78_05860 [Spirochaetales bacterium]|nr:hypothetical protein [Spirochaetales bacterium]